MDLRAAPSRCRLIREDADSFRRYNFHRGQHVCWNGPCRAHGNQASKREQKVEERTVFVTGSLIPQRVKLQQ